MKFTLFLNGLLLLFLLPNWTESVEEEKVDINTLGRIVNFFEQNYKRVDVYRHPRQYAIAINVPKQQCQQGFLPERNNFLTQETPENVKNAITAETNALYQGTNLIAAGVRDKIDYTEHSENLLLNPADNSLMSSLLRKRIDSCSVFYTFNSPCVNKCLNEKGKYNIIDALRNWNNHSGIKALVFKQIYWPDREISIHDLKARFMQIMNYIPLYRCASVNRCYACKGEGNIDVNPQCLTQ